VRALRGKLGFPLEVPAMPPSTRSSPRTKIICVKPLHPLPLPRPLNTGDGRFWFRRPRPYAGLAGHRCGGRHGPPWSKCSPGSTGTGGRGVRPLTFTEIRPWPVRATRPVAPPAYKAATQLLMRWGDKRVGEAGRNFDPPCARNAPPRQAPSVFRLQHRLPLALSMSLAPAGAERIPTHGTIVGGAITNIPEAT